MKDKLKILEHLIQSYEDAIAHIAKQTSVIESIKFLSSKYLHRGVCYALIFKYDSKITHYEKYIPKIAGEEIHDNYWCIPPLDCFTVPTIKEALITRKNILLTILKNLKADK